MEKYPLLTIEYFSTIENFFKEFKIDKTIFFRGVCARWGIRKSDSPRDVKLKLKTFYRALSLHPEHFIDYSITWINTPQACIYSWDSLNENFIKICQNKK